MLPEPQHKYLRNLIMPAFTNEAIERLVPRMEAVLARYLDSWAGESACYRTPCRVSCVCQTCACGLRSSSLAAAFKCMCIIALPSLLKAARC
jgi:cytochrome P450